ncbi:MAG: nucleoside kinase [Alistipes sp.]|nr:nucleoside kinase [Alistipes sp.]
MNPTIRVICRNSQSTFEVEMGTPLTELAALLPTPIRPYLAALVNNRLKELAYRIYRPVTVQFVDNTSFEGNRVLQRTAWFILQEAARTLYPDHTLHIRHSLSDGGFYCEVDGMQRFSPEQAEALADCMRKIVAENRPIERKRMLTSEVRARYAERGFTDKIELLDSRPRLYSSIHTMGEGVGYFYGALAPSSGYLTCFDVRPYFEGFQLLLPTRTAPDTLQASIPQAKMTDVFKEYQSWVGMMGFPTVGAINQRTRAGEAGAMIKVGEAFHERKFALIADAISRAYEERNARLVLISGPSSSGKTTSSKRLAVQLGVLGFHPVLIALDDYFVDRDKTPRDKNGDYDYEALEAVDLALFNDHLQRLIRGEAVEIPRYDFITGRRQWHEKPLQLDERAILIVEGIHGLNPRLTPGIPEEQKFRIYISCFTSVAMDNLTRIATTDNRLLRRLIRDYRTRGNDAVTTLTRWASVRRGEEQHIFPYQENADVMLNSSLFYEISVLRPFAESILREVPDTIPEYNEAQRLLQFLDNFIPIPPDEIAPTSILREFIGGSTFKY